MFFAPLSSHHDREAFVAVDCASPSVCVRLRSVLFSNAF
jgi:hypothetical protein